MNSEEMAVEQYKMYCNHKEAFVDRSFRTNKFYLILVLAIVITLFLLKDYTFVYNLSSTLIFSLIGMCICIMWWINVDSYSFLIKIKLSKVVEELEKNLAVKPYSMEYEAIKDYRKNKKAFMFSDMQKVLALLLMLLFLVLFITEIIPMLTCCPIK